MPEGDKREPEILVWLVLAALVAGIFYLNAQSVPDASSVATPGQNFGLVLQSKYVVGADRLISRLAPEMSLGSSLTSGLGDAAESAGDRLCLVPVLRELEVAIDVDERVEAVLAGSTEPAALAAAHSMADSYHQADAGDDGDDGDDGATPATEPDAWIEYCGWLGELGASQTGDERHSRSQVLGQAERLAWLVLVAFGAGLLMFLVGCGLFVAAGIARQQGSLRSSYAVDTAQLPTGRKAYLETLLLFVLSLQLLGLVAAAILSFAGGVGGTWPLAINWLALPVLAWPVFGGVRWADWRLALGWHRGRGIWREICSGFVAYLASMPILVLGLLATAVLANLVDEQPYHPIVDWLQGDSSFELTMIFLLVTVWAPVMEESVFRGALYHYFRGRLGILMSSILVGGLFAVIHPQGLVGLPFLTSLAVCLALAREWRGSLIASMVMHALHNGILVMFMMAMFR